MKTTILSTIEFTSVFLLAVEAIKLENLGWLKSKSMKLSDFLNPKIEFVEGYTPPSSFIERHIFKVFLLIMFLIGLLLLSLGGYYLGIQVSNLLPQTAPDWAALFFTVLFTPVLGLLVYTFFLKVLSMVIKALIWIENSTKSGVVGILGFLLYAIQFIAK